jgi:hypothetical protein
MRKVVNEKRCNKNILYNFYCIKLYKYYNNNYTPIYHVEKLTIIFSKVYILILESYIFIKEERQHKIRMSYN